MRINHNISSMITNGALFKVNREMSKSLEKLSTGLRINRASDDAAGLGVSENLRTQVRGTAQAIRNAQDGIAAITVAEGAANEISDILQRMRELAIQASNDTLTSTERSYINTEVRALVNEIDRIAKVTNYNKLKVLTGTEFGNTSNASTLWIDANGNTAIDALQISINGLYVMTESGSALSAATRLSSLSSVDVNYLSSAKNAITTLDAAINVVNEVRANMGAYINRLEHAVNNLLVSNTNQQAAESLIRDVDFAQETSHYTRNQILIQSGTAMLAQANAIPQSVLQLLG
ncbi:MAG: flagellin [Chitinispirillaceae bacterium]|nr:flagellin [Chitinispirillaceae bacterium]